MLQKIIDANNIKYFDGCTLKKTKVYLRERRWEIVLEAPNYIDTSIIAKVEDSLKERIGCLDDIRIVIEYSKSKEWFYSNFNKVWEDIYNRAQREGLSWSRWLSKCRPELDEDNILLHINNPMIAELINTKSTQVY